MTAEATVMLYIGGPGQAGRVAKIEFYQNVPLFAKSNWIFCFVIFLLGGTFRNPWNPLG